jgi:hypothetical protein
MVRKLDETTATLVIGLAAAMLTAILQYVRKGQSNRQGDQIVAGFGTAMDMLDVLAAKYPGLEKDVQYAHVVFDQVKAAWNDSRVSDTQLQASIDSLSKLIGDIKNEVAKVAK